MVSFYFVESTVRIIVGVLVPFVVIVALVIVCVCLPKKKIKLPKSLVSSS